MDRNSGIPEFLLFVRQNFCAGSRRIARLTGAEEGKSWKSTRPRRSSNGVSKNEQRTAVIASTVTVFYPLFVNLSFAVFSEGPYLTVLLSGIYLLRTFDRPSLMNWPFLSGGFGLAYLVRQEADHHGSTTADAVFRE